MQTVDNGQGFRRSFAVRHLLRLHALEFGLVLGGIEGGFGNGDDGLSVGEALRPSSESVLATQTPVQRVV